MDYLAKLRILIGRTDKDNILTILLDLATEDLKALCNRDDVPTGTSNIIIQMVLERYNRLGTEGLTAQSFSGASENFSDGYSAQVLSGLARYRKARFL